MAEKITALRPAAAHSSDANLLPEHGKPDAVVSHWRARSPPGDFDYLQPARRSLGLGRAKGARKFLDQMANAALTA